MLTFLNILGFLKAKWRVIALVLGGIILFFVLFSAGHRVYTWLNPPPKLDEKQIQKAQVAIATEDRKAMVEVLAESDTKDKEIDSNIKQIEQNREDAKKNYDGLSNDQLADELNKRAQQP